MGRIRRLVLDTLKPHDPSIIELADKLTDLDGVSCGQYQYLRDGPARSRMPRSRSRARPLTSRLSRGSSKRWAGQSTRWMRSRLDGTLSMMRRRSKADPLTPF